MMASRKKLGGFRSVETVFAIAAGTEAGPPERIREIFRLTFAMWRQSKGLEFAAHNGQRPAK